LIGLKLKKKFQIPWVADLRDPWTDIYYYDQLYPGMLARRINKRYERRVLETADRIVTVGPSLQTLFSTKYSLPEKQVAVVYNGYDEDDFSHLPAEKEALFTVTYVGTISDVYPIGNFVEIFAEMLKNGAGMKLRFVGDISAQQRKRLASIPSEHMEYVDYVNHSKAIEYMERSHLLLLVIPKHASSKGILTGKLFEYLASGKPVLGIGPSDGDASAVLKECQAGEMIDFKDRERLKIVLSRWLDLHKQGKNITDPRGRESYSRKNLTASYARQLNEITGGEDH
jgi:glycosyltransferase involved in cell wall biosynthesis